jgi:hypothetical protein
VKLDSNADHCGACGHGCGGGTCTAGRCAAVELYKGTNAVVSIDVGANDLFLSTSDGAADNKLLACPKTGCKTTPRQVASMTYPIHAVQVIGNGTITFISAPQQTTERPAVYACPNAACPAIPTSIAADGLNGFEDRLRAQGDRIFMNAGGSGIQWSQCQPQGASCTTPTSKLGTATRGTSLFAPDVAKTYFIQRALGAATSAISWCANTDTACVPAVLVDNVTSTDDITGLVVRGQSLYWAKAGRDGFNEGRIRTCDLGAGTCAPKDVAVGLASPIELAADLAGNVYWITKDPMRIQRCAPNNCPGGPQDLTPKLDQAHSLTIDADFVYWAEKASVSRIAKP